MSQHAVRHNTGSVPWCRCKGGPASPRERLGEGAGHRACQVQGRESRSRAGTAGRGRWGGVVQRSGQAGWRAAGHSTASMRSHGCAVKSAVATALCQPQSWALSVSSSFNPHHILPDRHWRPAWWLRHDIQQVAQLGPELRPPSKGSSPQLTFRPTSHR